MKAQPGPRILFVQLSLFPDRILPLALCIASPFAHCLLHTRPGFRCLPHMPFHLILTQILRCRNGHPGFGHAAWLQDLSSLARDRTFVPCVGSVES